MMSMIPLQNHMAPRVMMKEGTLDFTTIKPLINPITTPQKSPASTAIHRGTPALNSFAMTSAVRVKVAPTDRSNSPAIISRLTPSAMMTSEGIALSISWIFPMLR